jgi:hypothetical protein
MVSGSSPGRKIISRFAGLLQVHAVALGQCPHHGIGFILHAGFVPAKDAGRNFADLSEAIPGQLPGDRQLGPAQHDILEVVDPFVGDDPVDFRAGLIRRAVDRP